MSFWHGQPGIRACRWACFLQGVFAQTWTQAQKMTNGWEPQRRRAQAQNRMLPQLASLSIAYTPNTSCPQSNSVAKMRSIPTAITLPCLSTIIAKQERGLLTAQAPVLQLQSRTLDNSSSRRRRQSVAASARVPASCSLGQQRSRHG